jgi:hypothetical protein
MQSLKHSRCWLRASIVLWLFVLASGGWLTPTSAQDNGSIYVYQTGHSVQGAFLAFWNQHGGVDTFGYPVTEAYIRRSDERIVQYFQHARLELHQEGGQQQVVVGNLGAELLKLQRATHPPIAPFVDSEQRRYFPDTGHSLQGTFKAFWEAHNGALLFGAPISEEFLELGADGIPHTVQYFEKTRFELHGEGVRLGLLGELMAPCHLMPSVPPDALPVGPIPEGEPDEDAPECIKPNLIATGYVYPSPARPGTVMGLDARGFLPAEVVSMWLNVPGGTVRKVPYTALADENGDILVGFEIGADAVPGTWEMVAQGVSSRRMVVAPFVVQP